MQNLNLNGLYIKNAVNSGWTAEYIVEAILAYRGYIYKIANQKSGGGYSSYHHRLCEECQSVVTIKLFSQISQFRIKPEMSNSDIENTFDTFMKRMICNAVINFLKKVENTNKNESLFDLAEFDDPSEGGLIKAVYVDTYDIDNFYFRLFNGSVIEVSNTLLGLALTALKEFKRDIFLTSALFDMSDDEISILFSSTVGKVQHHKKSAKAFLKKKLGKYYENEEEVMNNQKSRCFAYNGGNDCCVLTELICEKRNCAFFKTDKQYREDCEKSMKSLSDLPKERQREISDRYYDGKMPWLDNTKRGRKGGKQ